MSQKGDPMAAYTFPTFYPRSHPWRQELWCSFWRQCSRCSWSCCKITAGAGDGWSSPLLLVYSVFLLLLYFAWVALFAALLALLIYPILKKLRI